MSRIFDGVKFYVVPETAHQLQEQYEYLVNLLEIGSAEQMMELTDEVTHIICNSSDYYLIEKKEKDLSFFRIITPKWVFVSNTIQRSMSCVGSIEISLLFCRVIILQILSTFSLVVFFIFIIALIHIVRYIFLCVINEVHK